MTANVHWEPYVERPVVKRTGEHVPTQPKRFPWPYCARCGLVYLKNEVSRRAVRAKCVWTE